jgi:hypothetical protein
MLKFERTPKVHVAIPAWTARPFFLIPRRRLDSHSAAESAGFATPPNKLTGANRHEPIQRQGEIECHRSAHAGRSVRSFGGRSCMSRPPHSRWCHLRHSSVVWSGVPHSSPPASSAYPFHLQWPLRSQHHTPGWGTEPGAAHNEGRAWLVGNSDVVLAALKAVAVNGGRALSWPA